jgi:hypothetical protein
MEENRRAPSFQFFCFVEWNGRAMSSVRILFVEWNRQIEALGFTSFVLFNGGE